jgi:hypothetical protein
MAVFAMVQEFDRKNVVVVMLSCCHDVVVSLQVFDRKNVGSLDAKDISLFFTAVHQKWVDAGNYELSVADVKDELYDMIKPTDATKAGVD